MSNLQDQVKKKNVDHDNTITTATGWKEASSNLISVVNVAVEHVVADLEHLVREEEVREGDLVASGSKLIIAEGSELQAMGGKWK